MATPAPMPASFTCWTVADRARWATRRAPSSHPRPASASSSTNFCGSITIIWMSSGSDVRPRIASTIIGPKVSGGTNRPSMMSTWMPSAPPASASATWSPSLAKSADRMDGTILMARSATGFGLQRLLGGLDCRCDLGRRSAARHVPVLYRRVHGDLQHVFGEQVRELPVVVHRARSVRILPVSDAWMERRADTPWASLNGIPLATR